MNSTILCNFDDVDLAELAVGRLRAKIPGLKYIEISKPTYGVSDSGENVPFGIAGMAAFSAPGSSTPDAVTAPVYFGRMEHEPPNRDISPQSVLLRVTCNTMHRRQVEAQLINLGALRVHAFDELPPS